MMSRQSDSIMVFDLDILERNISRRLKFWDVPLQDVVVLPWPARKPCQFDKDKTTTSILKCNYIHRHTYINQIYIVT